MPLTGCSSALPASCFRAIAFMGVPVSLEGMSPLWQRLTLKMKVLVEKTLWEVCGTSAFCESLDCDDGKGRRICLWETNFYEDELLPVDNERIS